MEKAVACRERDKKAEKTAFSGPYIAKALARLSRYGIRRPAVVLVLASRR